MGLPKQDTQYECVLRNVPVTGTNHSTAFNPGVSAVGKEFPIRRDKQNGYDPYAVKVLTPGLEGQIGWIGMKTGHSSRVAELMDANPINGGYIEITQHSYTEQHYSRDPQRSVYGDVYLPKQAQPDLREPPPGITVDSIHMNGAGASRKNLADYVGQVLALETTETRTSVSLKDAQGNTIAWYRKAEFPHACKIVATVALVLDHRQVRLVSYQQAYAAGYREIAGGKALEQEQVGGSRIGKTADATQRLKDLLFIPASLQVMADHKRCCWLISDDGDHWLHLVDKATSAEELDAARLYAFENYRDHYTDRSVITALEQLKLETEMVKAATQTQPQTQEEITMDFKAKTNQIVNFNKNAAGAAAYMEAGRIANNQFIKLVGKHLPPFVRGYVNTPYGKLIGANAASVAVRQLRPDDKALIELTDAMAVQAFQEIYQTVDIEGFLDNLLNSPEIKRATGKLAASKKASDE